MRSMGERGGKESETGGNGENTWYWNGEIRQSQLTRRVVVALLTVVEKEGKRSLANI